MGYTHYWYREKEISFSPFSAIVKDFKTLLPLFKVLDVKLADGRGEGEPVITDEEITFNGSVHCGHPVNHEIVIPWPAPDTKNGVAPSSGGAIAGNWFAGVLLNQRTCDGDCSYETFDFPRIFDPDFKQYEEGTKMLFDFCKTAYRPYDLAVTTFLIIAKHHMKKDIRVSSDGEIKDWWDAATICQNALGYGHDFKLRD
jgi:hypothetical protein